MFYTNILVFVSAISAQNLCSKFTPNIKKILDCVNVNKNVIKIVNLKNESSGIAADDFVNEMIPNLDIPVQYSDYDDQFEYLRIDFTELYSWTGEMFQLRKTQENQEIITDGVSIAHPYQSLRGADSASIILVVENIDILEDYLTGTVRSPFHSTRATFNLVILTLEDNILERVTRILGSIWRNYGIILAVLIFTCEDNIVNYVNQYELKPGKSNITDFYSWGNLKRVIVNEDLTLICDRNLDNFPKHFNGFPQRVFMFQEDPVAVNWDRFPKSFQNSYLGKHRKQNPMTAGYNGLTMAGLVEYINFTPLYIVPKLEADKYAYKDNKGLIKGSGEVSYSKFDIVGMLHFITDNQGMDYEFLHPIFFDNYCVVAPIANSMPLFIASMKCFTLGSWIFIFTIPYISAFILKILNKFNPSHDGLKVSNFVQLTGLFTFVLISITANIKTKSSIQRWLLSGCMAFSIIFSTLFNANLTSGITTDKRYNEINDLRSLSESSFDIVINSPFMYNIAFGDESRAVDPIMKKLQSKLRLGVDSVYQTVERKACVFRMKSDYEIVNMKIQAQFGEEKLHLVNECPRSYHSTFLVRKGWSFSPLFNRRIINLVESGLIDFWKESSKFALNLNSTIELHEHGIKVRNIQFTFKNSWAWFVAMFLIHDDNSNFYYGNFMV